MMNISQGTICYFIKVLNSCETKEHFHIARSWIERTLEDTYGCGQFEAESIMVEIYREVLINKLGG